MNGALWLAASGHHLSQGDAKALGWAVVVLIIAVLAGAVLRVLGILR